MARDPLDQFRRNPSQQLVTASRKKPYRAFAARRDEAAFTSRSSDDDEEEGLVRTAPRDSFEIRQCMKPWFAPEYRYFMLAFYDESGKSATLLFTHMLVKIHGEHLQELLLSVRRKTCVYIQVFDEREFQPPPKGKAIVRGVEVAVGKALEQMVASMDKMLEAHSGESSGEGQPEALKETV